VLRKYFLPSGANLEVKDEDKVYGGDILAKIPREVARTKDITGGLPRAEELFEARRPKSPAVISEIDGAVEYGGLVRGYRKLTVRSERGGEKEYLIPKGAHLSVGEGEKVRAGTPLMNGPVNPHDILKVLGEKELAEYLLREIQEVYRLQGVSINDKHIEIIIRQMLRWVKVEEVGDTEFLVDEQVDKFIFQEENEKVIKKGGKPAKARPLLLGITKSALSTESFISAASFQETTRVLTEASLYGKVDNLRGLKENIIMGRLIPAGTGYKYYHDVELKEEKKVEPEKEVEIPIRH
jgi:DNA-directed RNA polymerase subunit beta'